MKFELIQDIVVILVTSKNEEHPLKNKDARVATTQNMDFSNSRADNSAVRSQRSDLVEIRTSKNKEDPNKNEGARVATTLNIDFSHSQWQITPQSEVGSGRNSKSSEML